MNEVRTDKLRRIKSLSVLLDSKFQGPLGYKFGLDAVIGLVPVVGDSVTSLLSFYIIIEAAYLGCPVPVLLRMVLNVLVENVLNFVPFLGNLFDFFWKSNQKNIELLMAYEASPHRVSRQSNLVIALIVLLLVGMLALVIYGGYIILAYLYELTLRAL